jgi:hypothetical protein
MKRDVPLEGRVLLTTGKGAGCRASQDLSVLLTLFPLRGFAVVFGSNGTRATKMLPEKWPHQR